MIFAVFIRSNIRLKKTINKFLPHLLISALLLVFFTTRLYRLEDRFGFDHDQEKAAFSSWELVKGKNFSLIGIETSTGGIFAGPALNWSHAIFLSLWNFDPVALGYQAIIFSALGVLFLFLFLYEISNIIQASIGASIYIFSARMISYDISGSPISYIFTHTLLVIILYYLISYKNKNHLLPILGFVLALGYHIHLTLLLQIVPIAILLFKKRQRFSLYTIISFFILFIAPLLTFMAFEARNGFLMTKKIGELLVSGQRSQPHIMITINSCLSLMADIIIMSKSFMPIWPIPVLIFIFFIFNKKIKNIYRELLIICILPIAPTLFYKGPMTEYYFLFTSSAFVILTSLVYFSIYKKNKLVFLILAIFLVSVNLHTAFTVVNPHSLKMKKDLMAYINSDAKGRKIAITYNIPIAYNYGFDYLQRWMNLKISTSAEKKYYIVHRDYLTKDIEIERNFGYFNLYSIE